MSVSAPQAASSSAEVRYCRLPPPSARPGADRAAGPG
jgi:hypothetical protein